MDIGNALRRAGRDDITFRSLIANTIIEIYPKSVKIQSVKVQGKKIIITTGNPLINSELQLLAGDIQKASSTKLRKLGIPFPKDGVFVFI